MSSKFTTIIKYVVTLIIGVGLLWYLINSQSPEGKANIAKGFLNADYTWILITMGIAVLEKIIRAYRWNLLLEPTGNKPPLKNTFNALMIAYFANTFAPRMGEVARCAIINKTDDVPVTTSFGTVVAERAVDFLCLLLIIPFALFLEYQKVSELLIRTTDHIYKIVANSYWLGICAIAVLIILTIPLYLYRKSLLQNKLVIKISNFIRDILISVWSIRNLNKKGEFIFCSILIWACYFFMTYLAFFSLEATAGLGLSAGLIVLVGGGLGMSAPVQAGMGAFHVMVAEILKEVYFVSKDWALPYAFLVWGSQTITVFIGGLISLIIVFVFSKKSKHNLHNADIAQNTYQRNS